MIRAAGLAFVAAGLVALGALADQAFLRAPAATQRPPAATPWGQP